MSLHLLFIHSFIHSSKRDEQQACESRPPNARIDREREIYASGNTGTTFAATGQHTATTHEVLVIMDSNSKDDDDDNSKVINLSEDNKGAKGEWNEQIQCLAQAHLVN